MIDYFPAQPQTPSAQAEKSGPVMDESIGILAFGSLIDDPGAEIEAALVGRKLNIQTPFGVEFARSSNRRGGAPTLVPLEQGGAAVAAQILLLNVPEREAADRLWRREINRVGEGGHYTRRANPGPDTLIIDRYVNFAGVDVILAARFAATIVPLTAARLAELAIESARLERTGRRHQLSHRHQAEWYNDSSFSGL